MLASLEQLGVVKTLCFQEVQGGPGDCPLPRFPSQLERLLSPVPSLFRCFRSATFARLVGKEAADCQVCFCLGLQMAQYARLVPAGVPVILDNFNVESDILWGLARQRRGLKRFYWQWQALRLQRYEKAALRAVSTALAISSADARRFAQLAPEARVVIIRPGLDLNRLLSIQGPQVPDRLVFVGALDWHVNVDCVLWFAREVFPRIKEVRPGATFQVVGRRPSPELANLEAIPGVTLHADVPDISVYVVESSAIVVPLRYGSGVQGKVIEGLAAGRPVVTSPVGLEGLDLTPGVELLVAEQAEDFAKHCLTLLEKPEVAAAMANVGRLVAGERFCWPRLHRDLEGLMLDLAVIPRRSSSAEVR
ncbi:MAG: glycosyltransferase [Pirellulales bacterium]